MAVSEVLKKFTLPVVALRDLVVFPGTVLPVAAGRPRSLRAIEAAITDGDKRIFAVLQRENSEEIDAGGLHTIGTIATVDQVQRGLGGMQLLVSGERRGIAFRIEETDGYLTATVGEAEELKPQDPEELAFVALHREARARVAELGERSGLPKDVIAKVLSSVDEAGRFADLVAGYLDITSKERQTLLENLSVEDRLRKILTLVQRQLSLLEAQEEIKSKVQEELGDRQREMYLREQLKAIQAELGDGEGVDELAELKEKVEALNLPAGARKEVDRELSRLERMGRESMESQVIRTYIETIAELPWNDRSDDQLDLKRAAEILHQDHYALDDIKDRILEFLAVRRLRADRQSLTDEPAEIHESATSSADGESTTTDETTTPPAEARTQENAGGRSPILLFAGPPGVGKTSLAKSIARAMGREYVRVSLGGVRDEADIRGHRRTYVAAMPGRIIQGMKQAGTKNPVFLLDEIDKVTGSFHGDPAAALLEVLDPAQNDTFTDHYLGLPFDLSEVLFITTANFLQNIPQPLLDRMEIVEFSGYTEREKLAIAQQYLVPRQLEEGGLDADQLQISEQAITKVISSYTREAGVRQLERELGRLVRKMARKFAEGAFAEDGLASEDGKTAQPLPVTLDNGEVTELLGRARVHPERAARADQVGVATGMYYTPVGGDIMFVEASTMKGKGELTLTGQLGDVMKESAKAAWTYARSHAEALHIDPLSFDQDLHIHVPAGAIPKDGPSAGVTMATSLISVLSGRPVRHDIAMTGEITLSGRVLPIGGVKEKVLGAVRSGIHRIVIPKENEVDLEDVPEEVRDQLEVYPTEELGEVLAVALRDASFERGRLLFKGEDPSEIRRLSGRDYN